MPEHEPPRPEEGEGAPTHAPLDLNRIFSGNELKLSPPETPEDGKHRRHMELVRFYLALAVFAIIFVVCLWGIFSTSAAVEDKKWFTGIIGLMVGAVAGYLFKGK